MVFTSLYVNYTIFSSPSDSKHIEIHDHTHLFCFLENFNMLLKLLGLNQNFLKHLLYLLQMLLFWHNSTMHSYMFWLFPFGRIILTNALMPLVCSGWRLSAIGGHFFLMLFMLVSILNFFKLFVLIPCGNNFLKNIWFNCFQSDFFSYQYITSLLL